MHFGLEGIPAAVAGASRGLGFAAARELSLEGAKVAICGRVAESIESAAEAIAGQSGNEVVAVVADLSTPEGPQDFIRTAASRLGGLQVLVTNSGGPPTGAPSAHDDEAWMAGLELNFLSTVRLARAGLPYLEAAGWGRIVCITSSVVKEPDVRLSLSSAARAAATAFAKSLSTEVAARGITVNCVMPGYIVTDRLRSLAGAPDDAGPDHAAFGAMIARVPAGRIGTAEEFAAAVAFLCSRRASFITGSSLAVDGGLLRGIV